MFSRPSIQYFDDDKIKSSESAINFLQNIDISELEYYMYPDTLGIFTGLYMKVGKYEVTVKMACYDLTSCIKVKIKNEILFSEVFSQTKVVCYIGQTLKTLYQTFEEFLQCPGHKFTKRVTVKAVEKGYEVTRETTQNDTEEHLTKFFSKSMMQGYISEGAAIILHRLLTARGIPDDFSVIVFNPYWELSSASYKKLDNLKLPIRDEKVEVSGIERLVYSADDYETIWQMYFVPDGHLMSKAQVGSPVSMKVLELTDYIEKDSFLTKPTFNMTELNWEDDVQLYSTFFDIKEANKSNCIKYLRDNMEIKTILKDFMQDILIRKPENPFEFASRYFITLSCRAKPNYRYENSNSTIIDLLL